MPKNTNKLTIGFVVDDGLDSTDGVQQYVLTIGSWMATQGHSVHYFAGETKRTDMPSLYSMSKNLRVKFNGNTLTTPLPASYKSVDAVFSGLHLDVLHIQMPYSPFMAARIIKRAPKSVHIIGTYHILPFGVLQSAATRLLGLSLRGTLKRFNAFVSVSSAAQKFAAHSFGITSVVIPNAVDISSFKPKKPFAKNKVLNITFLGRLVDRKGCFQLLQAIYVIRNEKLTTHPFIVNIYGRGKDEKMLKTFAEENNLLEVVVFHGFVSEYDKPAVLSKADIAVFPSIGAESFGIVLIEAMAAQAGVVIGGDNPGYRTVLEDNEEMLVTPKKPIKFAFQLAELINNPDKRLSLHKIQQQNVRQYDVAVVGSKLLGLYCKK